MMLGLRTDCYIVRLAGGFGCCWCCWYELGVAITCLVGSRGRLGNLFSYWYSVLFVYGVDKILGWLMVYGFQNSLL